MPTDITYTGRLELPLITGNGTPVVSVDVTIRLDVVEFHVLDRNMAIIDRDVLADWLDARDGALENDELTWFVMADRVCLSVDGSEPYLVAETFVRDLLRVL